MGLLQRAIAGLGWSRRFAAVLGPSRVGVGVLGLVMVAGCSDDQADPGGETEGTAGSTGDDPTGSSITTPTVVDDTSDVDTGTCEVGEGGCPCGPGGACDAGLVCTGGTCVPPEPVCGDGVVSGDEECDPGEEDLDDMGACKTNCTLASCGDGFVGPEEICDDGNLIDHDDCTNACMPPACGDGVLHDGEICDDGNGSNSDACVAGCQEAECGDGFTWSKANGGTEECDDGNAINTDACLIGCMMASCGDLIIWEGEEECDGTNLGGATCANLGLGTGTLSCNASCELITTGCIQ